MGKLNRTVVAVITVALLVILVSPAAMAAITGSAHDFSLDGWSRHGEICRPCHAPHDKGRTTGLVGLLWNHEMSAQTYVMYSSGTLDGAIDAEPTGTSKMCLGCHDGTVALDDYDGHTGGATNFLTGNDVVPGISDAGNPDMRATHPISVVYDDTLDLELMPTTTSFGSSGTIADVLEGGKVQCHSCHDVHNGPETLASPLLRVSQASSGLCLACHDK